MAAIRGRDTGPELRVRRLLHKLGYRYRLHEPRLPGRPDIAFPGRKKVIEVRGCFWHCHDSPSCRKAKLPATRSSFWSAKLDSNVARDRRNIEALTALGWSTLIVWECELRNEDELQRRLTSFLGSRVAAKR